MPRKRMELDREDKIAEILRIAERQLRQGGVESLSIAAIARELGVAQNAVRWYFPSRAHLLVGTLRRMLHAIAARKPKGQDGAQRILWWTDQLAALHRFRAALQQQATTSPVADFVRELDASLDRMLHNAFRGEVPEHDLEPTVATFRATVEGTYAQGLSRAKRRRVLSYALERFGHTDGEASELIAD